MPVPVFATVAATAGCPNWWTWRVIRSDTQCFLGNNPGCLFSEEANALSARTPLEQYHQDLCTDWGSLTFLFLRQSPRLFWLSLTNWISAFCSSWGERGPSLSVISFSSGGILLWCLARRFQISLSTLAVTQTSFLQLENFQQSIRCSALVWRQTNFAAFFFYFGSVFDKSCGHSFSGKQRNLGPYCHLLAKSFTGVPRETSSATFNSPGICFHWVGSVLV